MYTTVAPHRFHRFDSDLAHRRRTKIGVGEISRADTFRPTSGRVTYFACLDVAALAGIPCPVNLPMLTRHITEWRKAEILRARNVQKAADSWAALRMTVASLWLICDVLCHPENSMPPADGMRNDRNFCASASGGYTTLEPPDK